MTVGSVSDIRAPVTDSADDRRDIERQVRDAGVSSTVPVSASSPASN
jgi:hypothetical protein